MSTKKSKNRTQSVNSLDKPTNKGMGRPKGSMNKKTEHLFEMCAKHDFDPIETLIYFASGDWKALGYKSETIAKIGFQGAVNEEYIIQPELRKAAAVKLLEFMYPKRKSIEIKNDENSGALRLAYSKDDLQDDK